MHSHKFSKPSPNRARFIAVKYIGLAQVSFLHSLNSTSISMHITSHAPSRSIVYCTLQNVSCKSLHLQIRNTSTQYNTTNQKYKQLTRQIFITLIYFPLSHCPCSFTSPIYLRRKYCLHVCLSLSLTESGPYPSNIYLTHVLCAVCGMSLRHSHLITPLAPRRASSCTVPSALRPFSPRGT